MSRSSQVVHWHRCARLLQCEWYMLSHLPGFKSERNRWVQKSSFHVTVLQVDRIIFIRALKTHFGNDSEMRILQHSASIWIFNKNIIMYHTIGFFVTSKKKMTQLWRWLGHWGHDYCAPPGNVCRIIHTRLGSGVTLLTLHFECCPALKFASLNCERWLSL